MRNIRKILAGYSIPNWLIIGILTVILFVIVALGLCGWKITYAPDLDNSWDAIAAVGGWVSAIISGIAIWFAAAIPKRIANEQNKISLFEKRFVCYNTLLKYVSFAESISSVNNPTDLKKVFSFNYLKADDKFEQSDIIKAVKIDEVILMSGLFLFSNSIDGATVTEIIKSFLAVSKLVGDELNPFSSEQLECIRLFCHMCDDFNNSSMIRFRQELEIGNLCG